MSMAKGRSAFQPVYQPTTLPFSTTGRSYLRPPTSPTGHTETPLVERIWERGRKEHEMCYRVEVCAKNMTHFMFNKKLDQAHTSPVFPLGTARFISRYTIFGDGLCWSTGACCQTIYFYWISVDERGFLWDCITVLWLIFSLNNLIHLQPGWKSNKIIHTWCSTLFVLQILFLMVAFCWSKLKQPKAKWSPYFFFH